MTTANDDIRERVSRIEGRMEALATKEDMQAVRTEVQSVRTDVESLRADMHRMESRLIRWWVGSTVALFTIAVAVLAIVIRFVA